MQRIFLRSRAVMVTFLLLSACSNAQKVIEPTSLNPEWSRSYTPFRIAGNLYYVGTYDLACYLIVTPRGNILINTGLASSTAVIKSNIESLGFQLSDTKIILTTQAHFDHVGAMAEIKRMTGATVVVNEKDAEVMRDGGRSDYVFGGESGSFEPVAVDRILKDNDVVSIGDSKVTALHHPGHTRGSTSYLLSVADEQREYRVLIANMPSIVVDKKFSDVTAYPDIAKDYAYTFKAMRSLSFDLWVSSHASQFGLHDKRKPGDDYNPSAFNDRQGYEKALADLEARYIAKLKQY
jgi:metallo-beta-lactamase class B